jgi:hypothetical protein
MVLPFMGCQLYCKACRIIEHNMLIKQAHTATCYLLVVFAQFLHTIGTQILIFQPTISGLPFWDASPGLSLTKPKPGPALSSWSGLGFLKPEPKA